MKLPMTELKSSSPERSTDKNRDNAGRRLLTQPLEASHRGKVLSEPAFKP